MLKDSILNRAGNIFPSSILSLSTDPDRFRRVEPIQCFGRNTSLESHFGGDVWRGGRAEVVGGGVLPRLSRFPSVP